MPFLTKIILWCLMLALAACLTPGRDYPSPPPDQSETSTTKIGKPYKIGGNWYYPKEDPNYDQTGYASWYGPNFHGRPTANGERFDMNELSAAHKTLPMPSHVLVTNLDNGRSLRLRVNDRGPFAKGRILDVSRRAAQLLGFEKRGVARVRVQYVKGDGSLARAGQPTSPRRQAANVRPPVSPPSTNTQPRQPSQLPPLGEAVNWIQIGAFSSYENASALKKRLTGFGVVTIELTETYAGNLYRIRVGPFADRALADRTLQRVRARGFKEARVMIEYAEG